MIEVGDYVILGNTFKTIGLVVYNSRNIGNEPIYDVLVWNGCIFPFTIDYLNKVINVNLLD